MWPSWIPVFEYCNYVLRAIANFWPLLQRHPYARLKIRKYSHTSLRVTDDTQWAKSCSNFHQLPSVKESAQHITYFLVARLVSYLPSYLVQVGSSWTLLAFGSIYSSSNSLKFSVDSVTTNIVWWFQFPIECSLPWMLVEHVIESNEAGLLESILMPFDIYNDAADYALRSLKQRFLYDEIEAEVNY